MPSAASAQISCEGGAYWARRWARHHRAGYRAGAEGRARARTGLDGEVAVARRVWPGPNAGAPRGAPIRGHAPSDGSRPGNAPFTDPGGGGSPPGRLNCWYVIGRTTISSPARGQGRRASSRPGYTREKQGRYAESPSLTYRRLDMPTETVGIREPM